MFLFLYRPCTAMFGSLSITCMNMTETRSGKLLFLLYLIPYVNLFFMSNAASLMFLMHVLLCYIV